jgi:ketosteroid isomerase-like protein
VSVPVALAEALPLDEYHRAGVQLINGNPDVYKVLRSRRDDATLANPFGPRARGWKDVSLTLDRAAANYAGGEAVKFENVSPVVGEDSPTSLRLRPIARACVGPTNPSPVSVRVTTVFRREDATWKVVHRHADPITMQRPAESVLDS